MRPLATAAIPVDENDVPILGAATRARELAPELYRRLFELGEPFVVFDDVLVLACSTSCCRRRDLAVDDVIAAKPGSLPCNR